MELFQGDRYARQLLRQHRRLRRDFWGLVLLQLLFWLTEGTAAVLLLRLLERPAGALLTESVLVWRLVQGVWYAVSLVRVVPLDGAAACDPVLRHGRQRVACGRASRFPVPPVHPAADSGAAARSPVSVRCVPSGTHGDGTRRECAVALREHAVCRGGGGVSAAVGLSLSGTALRAVCLVCCAGHALPQGALHGAPHHARQTKGAAGDDGVVRRSDAARGDHPPYAAPCRNGADLLFQHPCPAVFSEPVFPRNGGDFPCRSPLSSPWRGSTAA